MTFHEKLSKLTEDRKKNVLCRRAGLRPTFISSCLSSGKMPSVTHALALARVLGVSFEWLVDDAREWPPVPAETTSRELQTSTAA